MHPYRTTLSYLLLGIAATVAAQATTCGDCNEDGSVNILDALTGAQDAAGILSPPLSGTALTACDVQPAPAPGCQGTVDILDALQIAQFAAGLLMTLDCCLAPGGSGSIRFPTSGAHRGDIPVRFAAPDPEYDVLAVGLEFSTDSGATWSLATMSDYVLTYSVLNYAGESDETSYRTLNYTAGSGAFQIGEEIVGATSGATGRLLRELVPSPTGTIAVAITSGAFAAGESITGQSSGVTAIIGTVNPYSRPLLIGSSLFNSPAAASTANPAPGVFPSDYLVFVWDSETDIPSGASPAAVELRATIDDGTSPVVTPPASITVDNSPPVTDHVLISELVVKGQDFVEIHNPTASPVDLRDYYLTDAESKTFVWNYRSLPSGTGAVHTTDWLARFPAGTTIAPGQYLTVALDSSLFATAYGVPADFQVCPTCGGTAPLMDEAFPSSIGATAGLTDEGESVVLFHWDGVSPTVDDVDYVVYGDKDEAIDPAAVPGYTAGTPCAAQETLPPGYEAGDLHNTLYTVSRIDLGEGTETRTGGDGISGHDETSEDLSATWSFVSMPTPGRKNFARAPISDGLVVGQVVINEILYVATGGLDTNCNGVPDEFDDAFVELYNPTLSPVDISLLRIYDLRTTHTLRHAFAPGTTLDPHQMIVVWGAGDPTLCTLPCTTKAEVTTTGGWFFNGTGSGGDGIVLLNGGRLMDGHFDANTTTGASFARCPAGAPTFINHSTSPSGLPTSEGADCDGGCP